MLTVILTQYFKQIKPESYQEFPNLEKADKRGCL